MTSSPPTSSTNESNLSVALARKSASRRADRRRRTPKTSDPLQLLALVVAANRPPSKLICPLCASTFGRRCELKRHIAEVHNLAGARRFACKHPACGKSFTRKDALAKHDIVKHQGKRRFVCPTCSEKFTSRYDLSRHNVRVHSNVKKRFTCEFCAAGFSQKSQLTMHKGRVHSAAKTPAWTPPPSRPHTPDSAESRSSIDSLAAVAVAIAKEEESNAMRYSQFSIDSFRLSTSTHGPPSQNRAAVDHLTSSAKRTTPKEEAAAAALAADTILEAAAALQPKK